MRLVANPNQRFVIRIFLFGKINWVPFEVSIKNPSFHAMFVNAHKSGGKDQILQSTLLTIKMNINLHDCSIQNDLLSLQAPVER